MSFHHRWTSTGDPKSIFEAHRDGLVHFGHQLRGVASVERVATRSEGQRLHLTHRWLGDPAVVPWVLRPAVSLFVWEDRASWDQDELVGRWTITAPALGTMITIEGEHRFAATDDGCEVVVEGEIGLALVGALGGPTTDRFIQRLFDEVLNSAIPVVEDYRSRQTEGARSPSPE